jgi:hypothetical protein
MAESEANAIRNPRHDLANPLAAILAQTQLLLLDEDTLRAETVEGLREIEALARRMREMLRPAAPLGGGKLDVKTTTPCGTDQEVAGVCFVVSFSTTSASEITLLIRHRCPEGGQPGRWYNASRRQLQALALPLHVPPAAPAAQTPTAVFVATVRAPLAVTVASSGEVMLFILGFFAASNVPFSRSVELGLAATPTIELPTMDRFQTPLLEPMKTPHRRSAELPDGTGSRLKPPVAPVPVFVHPPVNFPPEKPPVILKGPAVTPLNWPVTLSNDPEMAKGGIPPGSFRAPVSVTTASTEGSTAIGPRAGAAGEPAGIVIVSVPLVVAPAMMPE